MDALRIRGDNYGTAIPSREPETMRTVLTLFVSIAFALAAYAAGPSPSCPIHGDIPLAPLFANSSKPIRSGRLAAQRCDGAYVTLVTVSLTPARERRKPKIHAGTTVFLPAGHDKLIEVHYSLMQGEEVLSTGSEEMHGDEGESNAENGADLWFESSQVTDPERVMLRVELSITDR